MKKNVRMFATSTDEFIFGTDEADNLTVGASPVTTSYGYKGKDRLIDASYVISNDLMHGNQGNDYFVSVDGNDIMFGGQGDDIFIVEDRAGHVEVIGGADVDLLAIEEDIVESLEEIDGVYYITTTGGMTVEASVEIAFLY